jgi:hypothetical protein
LARNALTYSASGVERSTNESIPVKPDLHVVTVGVAVEDALSLLRAAQEQMQEAKEALAECADEANRLRNAIMPQLKQFRDEIRDLRQSMSMETQQALTALKDVRQFFLSKDWEEELKRMKEFAALSREFKDMNKDRTFEIMCDTILNLMCKGEKQLERKQSKKANPGN